LGTALVASTAQAALQTWQFTGTVYQKNDGFVPPAFASIGNTLTVDYLFDTTASIESSTISVTFNGETSTVASSNINWTGSLDAINVAPCH
jgi:DeoR/GlpR family transcriptional regulator of sugar metabolism